MAVDSPSLTELQVRTNTDVQASLPSSNPQLRESLLNTIVTAFVGRVFEVYQTLRRLCLEIFVDTATGDNLTRWADLKGITRIPAANASGLISATGIATTVITTGTLFNSSVGNAYEVTADATILAQSLSITSLTRVGNIATAVTATEHHLTDAIEVTITGADQPEYNIVGQTVSIIDGTSFFYEVSGLPLSPATGVILANFTLASVNVISQAPGQDQNLAPNAAVIIGTPQAGVDNEARAQFSEVAGGTDDESDEDFRTRTIDAWQNPVANFNVAAIDKQAREVAGVTRVFIDEITPEIGDVTVTFLRDNDASIIPSAQEVQDVKDALLLIKPAHMSDASVVVLAPIGVTVDFIFTALVPDSEALRTAIEFNLDSLFRERTTVGEVLEEDAYRSAIFGTVSIDSGETVESFELSTPIGDIPIASGEIPVLGTITYTI